MRAETPFCCWFVDQVRFCVLSFLRAALRFLADRSQERFLCCLSSRSRAGGGRTVSWPHPDETPGCPCLSVFSREQAVVPIGRPVSLDAPRPAVPAPLFQAGGISRSTAREIPG